LFVLVAACYCACVFVRELPHGTVAWGLLLLASFAGWGSIVARLVVPGHRIDLGLRMAWGMAAVLAIGGLACLTATATRPLLFAIAVIGVVAHGAHVWRSWRTPAPRADARRSMITIAGLVALLGIVLIQLYVGAAYGRFSADDFNAYLVYPQKILSTGTFLEGFSLRRLSSYGGQSFLQTLTLAGADAPRRIALLDQGMCLAIVVALFIAGRGAAAAGLWLLPPFLLLLLPDIRWNTTSQFSGVALLFAIYRTAVAPWAAESPRRTAILLGLLAGAFTTLRHWYLVAVVTFLALWYLPGVMQALRGAAEERWTRLAGVATAAATMIVVLLPWMLLSNAAVGTPLYPVFSGNYRAEYGSLLGDNPEVDRWTFLWRNVSYGHPLRLMPLFLAATIAFPWRGTGGALPALGIASFVGFLVVVLGFPLSDEISMSRYCFAFTMTATLACLHHVTARSWADWRRAGVVAALAAVLVVAGAAAEMIGRVPRFLATQAGLASFRNDPNAVPFGATWRYQALQNAIPAGAWVIVMFDNPYFLDFERNPIEVIDVPGMVSPAPGIPFDTDENLVRYLTGLGYRFLAFVRPERSINQYRREGWRRMIGPPTSPLWGRAAPIVLQGLDRVESVARSHRPVYEDGFFVAVDLGAGSK
jgi:hypothetical protein